MTGDDIARLAYLGLLGLGIAGYYLTQRRENMGQTAQYAALWGLIFVGVIAAYGMWNDITRTAAPDQFLTADGQIEVPISRDGHFHLTLAVNGVPIDFLVDTGASQIVLSQADARRAGIALDDLAYLGSAQTANGVVRTAGVRLDTLALEGITDFDVRAVVNGGEMDGSLLGMAYLGQFQNVIFLQDRLLLTR